MPSVSAFDVGIVGAGVHGVTAAYHLARRGVSTVVFERAVPAAGPTGQASGVVRSCYTNSLLAEVARAGTDVLAGLGAESGFVRTGGLYLHGAGGEAEVRAAGAAHEVLTPDDLGARFPDLNLDGTAIGVWEDRAGYADPLRTTQAFAAAPIRSPHRPGKAIVSTTDVEASLHPLDRTAWASLTGPHARFAQGTGRALRYPADVSPIMAVPPVQDRRVWTDLRELAGPGVAVLLAGDLATPPDGWTIDFQGDGVQLIATDALESGPSAGLVPLGAADVPEMLDLVARTKPGPFAPRTYQLGTYLGVRRGGALVAMAGERLHPPGWTEISAVCTDPAYRGQGLATTLVRAVAHGIRGRGETPFMHASADNTNAIRLYRSIGFEIRRTVLFTALRTPA